MEEKKKNQLYRRFVHLAKEIGDERSALKRAISEHLASGAPTKSYALHRLHFLQAKVNRLEAVNMGEFLREMDAAMHQPDGWRKLVCAILRHNVHCLLKQKSPFHDALLQTNEGTKSAGGCNCGTTSVILACNCCGNTKMQYWMKADQSIFCGQCGLLQEPSFWIQPIGLSSLDPAKTALFADYPLEPSPSEGLAKFWAKQTKWRADFAATLDQYQGRKSVTNVPVKVVDSIIRFFVQRGLIVKDNHAAVRFANITPSLVLEALHVLQLTKHNEAANCIYTRLTGKLAYNLSECEKDLAARFIQVLAAYLELFERQSSQLNKSFFHQLYILFQLMRVCGQAHQVDRQFPMTSLKTSVKQQQQDALCKTIFYRLNWPFEPLFV